MKFCPRCNKELENKNIFCPKCGTRIVKNRLKTSFIILGIVLPIWFLFIFIIFISIIPSESDISSKNNNSVKKSNKKVFDNSINNKNNSKKSSKTKKQKKKYTNEFETVQGFTTMQSLAMNINDKTTLRRVKDLAYYVSYYSKNMPTVEYDGEVLYIVNSDEKHSFESTESLLILYYDYGKNQKLERIEYSCSFQNYKYYYYAKDHSKNYVEGPNNEKIYIDNWKDAFKLINERVGYTGNQS